MIYKDKDHPYSFHTRLSDYSGDCNGRTDGKYQRSLGDITEDDDLLEVEEVSLQDPKDEDSEDTLEPEKVLSMKKTAEIAAMFNNMRLDKICNNTKPVYPIHPLQKKVDRNQNTTDESLDFESSLGYLP